MTSSIAGIDNPARESSKEQYAYSVNSSPSSRSSTSDDVFSNIDARSSQSSAPSSVKGSPLTYDSEAPSDTDSLTHQHELEKSLRQASIAQPRDGSRAVAADLRRHPRRTCAKTHVADARLESTGKKPVPTLIRQCDRKEQFVEALVGKLHTSTSAWRRRMLKQDLEDTTTEMIEVIWPLSVAQCGLPQGAKSILGLRKFVQEVLRRSKTSYSTLQVALFYLVLLIPFVPRSEAQERREDPPVCRALRCGRRMFLAALILASKYLQDRNYTMLAWAKISGLKKEEICFNELAFLRTVNYDLHIPEQQFKDWADIVLKYSLEDECRRARATNGGRCEKWRAIVPHLTRDLFAVLNPECNAPAKQDGPMQGRQWTPAASPECWTAPSRSESPVAPSAFARPPLPRFLEPKAMTTVEMGLMSPRISKLETPCLPPINFDLTPAASTGRNLGAGSTRPCAMGMALQQAGAASVSRVSFESPVAVSRAKTMPCSRRSYLSTSDSSSADVCDRASWGRRTVPGIKGLQTTPCAKREPYPHPSSAVAPSTGDDATHAARALQDISCASSAYPTPMSMDSMTDGSSVASDLDEISTPKAIDNTHRPLVRNALKRERPISVCENETAIGSYLPQMSGLSNIIKHAGGIPVDYGSGVEDILGRSRHARSTSGSCDGARKRNRLDGAQIEAL